MSQLFGFGVKTPASAIPPPSPRRSDASVQAASDAALKSLHREGRASQFLTSPSFNATPFVDRQQTLGGV